jgi:putative restriction endonuclease
MLAEVAADQQRITYGALAARLGIHHRPVRHFLELIQDYCMKSQNVSLTILVVDKSGRLGKGFVAWDIDNLHEGFAKVHAHNWKNEDNPLQYAEDGSTLADLTIGLLRGELRAGEMCVCVKVRGVAQAFFYPVAAEPRQFRDMLLTASRSHCAVCGLAYPIALDAAHIKPWGRMQRVREAGRPQRHRSLP